MTKRHVVFIYPLYICRSHALNPNCEPFQPRAAPLSDESKFLLMYASSFIADSHPNFTSGIGLTDDSERMLSSGILVHRSIQGSTSVTVSADDVGAVGFQCLIENESIHDCSLDDEIALTYSRLGELIWHSQQTRHASPMKRPPPPPPPPIAHEDRSIQSEILGGEVDGMGDRLLLYRNRIRVMEDRLERERSRRLKSDKDLSELRSVIAQLGVEQEANERTIAQLRKDILVIRETNQLQEIKLKDHERLISFYVDEVKSLEGRLAGEC